MATEKDLKTIRDAIVSAENSIRTARQLLSAMLGDSANASFSASTDGMNHYSSGDSYIIEGVFTGDSMLGSDGNTYPVPHNYASKSLLVQ